ncbi:MAG: trimethylamine methyltransferase family protein [Anaerolineales bacterium]|jgi:trimethylamine--corrinoid protein Co-methyltransferase
MVKLSVLTDEDIEQIHTATLRILNETGVNLTNAEAKEALTSVGARVEDDRLFFPPDMVEREISKCPSKVKIRGREGDPVCLGDGTLHWHNLGGARDVYEPKTSQIRKATLQDVKDSAKLLDALESATTITPFFTPQDVPGDLMSLAMYRYSIPNTTKPLQGPGVQNGEEVKIAVDMAAVIGPPKEILSLSISNVSPLIFPDDHVDAIIEIARQGIAFGPLPCPIAGATAPFSLAGSIAQQNAEVITAIILAQVIQPGLPIIYCGRLAMMEPRTGISVWGGVEMGLASAATVQVGHRYGLPVNVYGLSTNSHVLDIQNGYERALNAVMPAMAGADELSGIGEMAAGVTGSYAQMVCDNEIAASVIRLRRGFSVNNHALGVEVIAEVMNSSRNFLGQKHSIEFMRAGEILFTKLAERGAWDSWDREGRIGMGERAQAEAERLISEHEVSSLSKKQEQELDELMKKAAEKLII